ncbi:hypothetical protein OIU79_025885 [Salix purpurea]|uniref:Uncharacterized protein n=1 Tax=Salix purpurea TaxID=77065 RepID=A0A9Q1A7W1_SALPP|nr:hypothetical protein OIU79_025885 [Salix purpurea]
MMTVCYIQTFSISTPFVMRRIFYRFESFKLLENMDGDKKALFIKWGGLERRAAASVLQKWT